MKTHNERPYIKGEWAEIPLVNKPGEYFKVDIEFEKEFRKYDWKLYGTGKTANVQTWKNGKTITWRKLLDGLEGKTIIFKNGDNLDFRISNIQVKKGGQVGYYGVADLGGSRYQAHCWNPATKSGVNGKVFSTASQAAKEADKMRIKYGGNLTRLNFAESLKEFKKEVVEEKTPIEKPVEVVKKKIPVFFEFNGKSYDLSIFENREERTRAHRILMDIAEDVKRTHEASKEIKFVEVDKIVEVEKEVIKYVEVVKPSILKRWFGKKFVEGEGETK